MNKITCSYRPINGFAISNALKGETVKVLTEGFFTSNESNFFHYVEQIFSHFFGDKPFPESNLLKFFIVLRKDFTCDIYFNDFFEEMNIVVKNATKAGEPVFYDNIADINTVKFRDLEIKEDEGCIYCFKLNWKFGLYFNFSPLLYDKEIKLDIDELYKKFGQFHNYLTFESIFSGIKDSISPELLKDGWFAFMELVPRSYKQLLNIYRDKFNFEERLNTIVDSFNQQRIEKITKRWEKHRYYIDKKKIIDAGIDAYIKDDETGFINSIHTIYPQIEGILQNYYMRNRPKKGGLKDLIKYLEDDVLSRTEGRLTLLLPKEFSAYLTNCFFKNFNLETGEVDLSRHTVSHGAAKPDDFKKIKALQGLLVMDQILFYIK